MTNRWIAVISCLIAAGCYAPPPEPGTTYYSVPQGKTTLVPVATLPNALCVLQAGENSDGPRLATDAAGHGRFFITPQQGATGTIVMRCEAGGRTDTQRFVLGAGVPGTAPPPPPPPVVRATRPALSTVEAQEISDEELLRRGYPFRPDERISPEAYAAWLRAVTRPAQLVEPSQVTNPALRHDVAKIPICCGKTLLNWSGVEVSGPAGPFAYVRGTWKVPGVTGEPNGTDYSSTWVGIDGDGVNDLVQAGTEQDVTTITFPLELQLATYRAWSQFLPQQPTEQIISGVPLNPGDEVFAEVFVANAGGSPDLKGAFGVFWLETPSGVSQIYTPVGGTVVGGGTAEWVVERTTLCGDAACTPSKSSLGNLANYTSASMINGMARKSRAPRRGGYTNCCDLGSTRISMVNNSGTTLSTPSTPDGTTAAFTWNGFK